MPNAELSLWSTSSKRKPGYRQELEIDEEKYGFCWIPPGQFTMGSSKYEQDEVYYDLREWFSGSLDFTNERQHKVKLTRGFWMLETLVPQELYNAVTKSNPSWFKGSELPVESVSYYDALRFCEALTNLLPNGLIATLPTEAQWEYACRAGTQTPYYWGWKFDADLANCNVNGWSTPLKTTPVGTYPSNPWGLYDMHGNVWEWIRDSHESSPTESVTDPNASSSISNQIVVRGGAYNEVYAYARSAFRYKTDPEKKLESLGFRIVLVEGARKKSDVGATRPPILRYTPQTLQTPPEWQASSSRPAGARQEFEVYGVKYGVRWVPPRTFDVYSTEVEENQEYDHEALAHGFWILEKPVTHELYTRFRAEPDFMHQPLPPDYKKSSRRCPVRDNELVCGPTFDESLEFCKELSMHLPYGVVAKLPTATQLGYAISAGKKTIYEALAAWHSYPNYVRISLYAKEFRLSSSSLPSRNDWGIIYAGGAPVPELFIPDTDALRSALFRGYPQIGLDYILLRVILVAESPTVPTSNEVSTSNSVSSQPLSNPNVLPPESRPAGLRQEFEIDGEKYGVCWIPPGEFKMGSPRNEKGRRNNETLRSEKITQGFWLLETPVTQKLFESVMKSNPSYFKGYNDRYIAWRLKFVPTSEMLEDMIKTKSELYKVSDFSYCPVESVSYDDALNFCKELSKLLPTGFRATLPTETQWEYACRAGTQTPYYWGDVARSDVANVASSYTPKCIMPVGSFVSNPWGLYDMLGSVWEWVLDWYDPSPTGSATGPLKGQYRVVRGGAWDSGPFVYRSAYRNAYSPETKFNRLGFRIVLDEK